VCEWCCEDIPLLARKCKFCCMDVHLPDGMSEVKVLSRLGTINSAKEERAKQVRRGMCSCFGGRRHVKDTMEDEDLFEDAMSSGDLEEGNAGGTFRDQRRSKGGSHRFQESFTSLPRPETDNHCHASSRATSPCSFSSGGSASLPFGARRYQHHASSMDWVDKGRSPSEIMLSSVGPSIEVMLSSVGPSNSGPKHAPLTLRVTQGGTLPPRPPCIHGNHPSWPGLQMQHPASDVCLPSGVCGFGTCK
jgi:hypothetical protein